MYQPATVGPPPGSDLLEAWQIYYRIAQKLGLQLEIFDGTNLPRPQVDMTKEPTTDEVFEMMCKNSAIPLERVRQYPHGAVFEDARVIVGARDADCTARQQIAEPHMMAELRGVREEDVMARRKTNDEYPFLMVSRRVQTTNSSGLRVEKSHKAGYNPAYMHPLDLERLSLKAGNMVEIASRHGSIIGFVEADPDLRPGVLSITHGFGARHGKTYDPRKDGANVNQLIHWEDDNDPYHGMPRMGALPVSVKAVEEKALAEAS
jgi:anaerobic selenocysteine-containing dehydrogenase